MTARVALLFLSLAAAGAAALTLSLASPATVRSPVPWATLAFSKSEVSGGGVYVAGRGRTRLVIPAATDPAWSPDGRRLAYLAPGADGAADVFVADADGTNRGRLTTTDLDETSPTWAPDGRRIAVERAGRIVLVRADGRELRLLARGAEPAWSPGGRRIAFSADGDLYVVRAAGGQPQRLTTSPASESSPAWAPDGRRLAFVSDETGAPDIRVLDLRSGAIAQLTADPAVDTQPAFAANGRRVLFVSDRAGAEQIVGVPATGGTPTPVAPMELPAHPDARPVSDAFELLPDFDQQPPRHLEVRRTGRRFLLWFTSAADNVGLGPFIVDGRRTRSGAMRAYQRVRLLRGSFRTYPEIGVWRYNATPDHSHWHLLAFQRYELRKGNGSVLVRDRKSGFCIGDRYGVAPGRIANRTPRPVFRGYCNLYQPTAAQVDAGTSVGYSDRYHSRLDGQNVDLTRVPAGRYVLVNRANPSAEIRELRYENNAASVAVRVAWPNGRRRPPAVRILATCPDSERC
ncbi:MAG TPA: lysyl oxidase family protein [Gaiellaceae bacterium]|nr:lysyl oxidase family protein [Gaiellaceae bacterium]